MGYELKWMSVVTGEHLDLRFRVLRENQPPESAHYLGIDTDKNTKFLGVFHNDKLVGCATLQVDPRNDCKYRIRGMAVEPEFRNQGVGTKIVKELQKLAINEGTGMWCNARIKAITLYEKCGFKIISDVFEIKPIGLHYDMEWNFE
jgi:GNAT superfamily N-acetyltransferase